MQRLIKLWLLCAFIVIGIVVCCGKLSLSADTLEGYFYAPVAYFNNETADVISDYIVANGRLVNTYDSSSIVNYTYCYDMNISGKLFTNDEEQGDNYVDFYRCRFYTDYQVFKSNGYRFIGSIDVQFELFSEQVEGDWFSVCYYDPADVYPNGELGQSFIYSVYYSDDLTNGYVYLQSLRTEVSPFTYLYKMLSVDIFNFAFDKGFNAAINSNSSSIYQYGYKDGVDFGESSVVNNPNSYGLYNNTDLTNKYDEGKRVGRAEALNENNPYTFENYFYAIFDAPIKMIFGRQEGQGLLNFDFLGINLSNFALAILTLGIIIKVLMIIL